MLSIRRRGKVYHCRGTVRVGRETREVKEHSTGCRERQAALAYVHRLEAEVRDEVLHGAAGRPRNLTCAAALHLYLDRPGGLHRMDIWRVGELGDVLGDVPLSDVLAGWQAFKARRCPALAPATVDRFRDTLQAALNYAGREQGFPAPQIPHVKFSNERVRFLLRDERDRLLAAYHPSARPNEVHVSDFLADILLNPETRASYPLDQVHETLVAFVDGSGLEEPLSRRHLWTVTRDEDDGRIGGSPLGIANNTHRCSWHTSLGARCPSRSGAMSGSVTSRKLQSLGAT
jgi:hypothetical protein